MDLGVPVPKLPSVETMSHAGIGDRRSTRLGATSVTVTKTLEEKILVLIKNRPEGARVGEIFPALQNQCSRRTLQRYLNKLIAEGKILKKGTNNSARYLHGHHVHGDHVVDNYGK